MRLEMLDETRLEALLEAGRGLVAQREVDAVLEELLRVACELTGARYAAIGVLDEDRRELERFVTRGIGDAEREAIGDLPRGHGILGELIRNPEPLRMEDVNEHPRSYGFPANHPPMHSFLGVPVLIRGEPWGNLYLTEKRGGPFDGADEAATVILADWAALAVDNARLHEDAARRRAEAERAVRRLEATAAIAGRPFGGPAARGGRHVPPGGRSRPGRAAGPRRTLPDHRLGDERGALLGPARADPRRALARAHLRA
jgi:GAF domain-containing protein